MGYCPKEQTQENGLKGKDGALNSHRVLGGGGDKPQAQRVSGRGQVHSWGQASVLEYSMAVLGTESTPGVSSSVLPPWVEEAQGQG